MAIGDWLVKRISALTRTATDADLTDSEYMAVDNASAYTRKITAASLATWVLGKIKSLSVSITAFRTGDVIPVDGPSGTAKMGKDDFLRETKKNSLVSLVNSVLTETYKIVKSSTSTGSAASNYPAYTLNLSRSSNNDYVGALLTTTIDASTLASRVAVQVKNLGDATAVFRVAFCKSENDWTQSYTYSTNRSLAAGKSTIVYLDLSSDFFTWLSDKTLKLVIALDGVLSQAVNLSVSMCGDVPTATMLGAALHSRSTDTVNARVPLYLATYELNGGSLNRANDGFYDVTRVSPTPGATTYFYLTFRVNYYIKLQKKLILLVDINDYEQGNPYVDQVVLNTQDSWIAPAYNFLPSAKSMAGNGRYIIIDFSKIDNLDVNNNTYRLVVGSATSAYSTTKPIRVGLFEYEDIPVIPMYNQPLYYSGDNINVYESFAAANTVLNSATMTRDSTGLYKLIRTPSHSAYYNLIAFSVNSFINANKKLVFTTRNDSYDDGAACISKLVLTNNSSNWTNPIYNFLSKNSNFFKTSEGLAVEIDFSLIPDLDTAHNDYYVLVGSDNACTKGATIVFGLFESAAPRVVVSDFQLKSVTEQSKIAGYITCWGDSLTAMGGWTSVLQNKSGLVTYNCGVGGESSKTIMARQGGDAMMIFTKDNPGITIPATTDAVELREGTIDTVLGNSVAPLVQGGGNVNPVIFDGVKGTLSRSSSKYYFARSTTGDAKVVDRDACIITNADANYNSPYLMVIFMGQNGGWDSDPAVLIAQHRKMIAHAKAENVLILGLSSGTSESRSAYESAMQSEFGRYFVSIRQYLAHPIYDANNQIVSCYGLADAGLTPTSDDLAKIAVGQVPSQLLSDAVHYTDATKTVIGNMLYRYCQDLGIF